MVFAFDGRRRPGFWMTNTLDPAVDRLPRRRRATWCRPPTWRRARPARSTARPTRRRRPVPHAPSRSRQGALDELGLGDRRGSTPSVGAELRRRRRRPERRRRGCHTPGHSWADEGIGRAGPLRCTGRIDTLPRTVRGPGCRRVQREVMLAMRAYELMIIFDGDVEEAAVTEGARTRSAPAGRGRRRQRRHHRPVGRAPLRLRDQPQVRGHLRRARDR